MTTRVQLCHETQTKVSAIYITKNKPSKIEIILKLCHDYQFRYKDKGQGREFSDVVVLVGIDKGMKKYKGNEMTLLRICRWLGLTKEGKDKGMKMQLVRIDKGMRKDKGKLN